MVYYIIPTVLEEKRIYNFPGGRHTVTGLWQMCFSWITWGLWGSFCSFSNVNLWIADRRKSWVGFARTSGSVVRQFHQLSEVRCSEASSSVEKQTGKRQSLNVGKIQRSCWTILYNHTPPPLLRVQFENKLIWIRNKYYLPKYYHPSVHPFIHLLFIYLFIYLRGYCIYLLRHHLNFW